MNILAIDSSGTSASAAIIADSPLPKGYIVIAESSVTLADLRAGNEKRKTHSETLMPMINRLFDISSTSIKDIDYIACTCGPGSFTGLRIGAAIAKGLAFAAEKPLIAVPTLDVMAYTVEGLFPEHTWIVPIMDARRGQVYSAFYCEGKRCFDYFALSIEELLDKLKKLSENSKIVFLGDGLSANFDYIANEVRQWQKDKDIIFAPPAYNRVQAVYAGAKAFNICDDAADESEFSLLYIRKPQAQREREAKLAEKAGAK